MTNRKWGGRALSAVLLAGSLGACDFIEVTGSNPNVLTTATLDQLWVSTQVNAFFLAEGGLARISSVFTQQLAGTDRQFSLLDRYVIDEETANGEFSTVYTGGGLIDIRRGMQIADSVGCAACKGLFQIHEAYMVGMTASIFGPIPYSEAVTPGITEPVVDRQEAVYAAVQALLDQAIANTAASNTVLPQMAAADFNFRGNVNRWRAVAYTLKARFYLHWVEAQRAGGAAAAAAQVACGGDCIAKAQAAAMNGIKEPAGNWRGIHEAAAGGEQNFFFQFNRGRAGYIAAGAYLVNLLQSRNDPRLPIYFDRTPGASGTFVGSNPGQNNAAASQLSTTGVGSAGYNQPIVLCAENQFILAETNYYQGRTADAQAALRAGVACQQGLFGITGIQVQASATGTALLSEIITQKYIALFLNAEAYNDYKRTCLPAIRTFNGQPVPRRLLYGQTERQTNRNIAKEPQGVANTNDPNGC